MHYGGICPEMVKEKIMLKIEFEYKDDWSHGEWRKQTCVMSSVKECIKVYGLGVDCEYRIVKVTDLEASEA